MSGGLNPSLGGHKKPNRKKGRLPKKGFSKIFLAESKILTRKRKRAGKSEVGIPKVKNQSTNQDLLDLILETKTLREEILQDLKGYKVVRDPLEEAHSIQTENFHLLGLVQNLKNSSPPTPPSILPPISSPSFSSPIPRNLNLSLEPPIILEECHIPPFVSPGYGLASNF